MPCTGTTVGFYVFGAPSTGSNKLFCFKMFGDHGPAMLLQVGWHSRSSSTHPMVLPGPDGVHPFSSVPKPPQPGHAIKIH